VCVRERWCVCVRERVVASAERFDSSPVEGSRRRSRTQGCVISKSVISYISWELMTLVIRLITFRADNISARALSRGVAAGAAPRKVEGYSNGCGGARPVHLIITMIKWIRTSR